MLIPPTTLIAYQLILTETELRAAIANPALMLPHYKAALGAKRDLPSPPIGQEFASASGPAEAVALTEAAAGQKPDLRTATLRIPLNDWLAFCAEFARLYPDYQDTDGQPDKYHIGLTARRCGFTEITESNFGQVVTALITHAQQSHPAPA